MAHSRSTQKRIRQNVTRRQINMAKISRLRNTIRKAEKALADTDKEKAKADLDHAFILIDKSASWGLIHKNKAARKKSRLMKRYNLMAEIPAE